jgi:uncharacterized membrane-anchored protein
MAHARTVAVLYYFETQRGGVPSLLALTLLIAVYLAVIEVRPLTMPFRMKAWWVSFVFLTHFIGYIVLRAYVTFRRPDGIPE